MFTRYFNNYLVKIFKLLLVSQLTLGLIAPVQAEDSIIATRVWPAQDYTRITLESNKPFVYKMQVISNPDRVVLDIENIELNQMMKSFNDKILPTDPYIKQIRVARFQKNVVRLVVDLKSLAKPNAFTLRPNGEYNHRLVLDVNPLKDPLMEMLAARDAAVAAQAATQQNSTEPQTQEPEAVVEPLPPLLETAEKSGSETKPTETIPAEIKIAENTKPSETVKSTEAKPNVSVPTETKPTEIITNKTDTTVEKSTEISADKPDNTASKAANVKPSTRQGREVIVALDAGHGGEDPGARGASGSREKDITLAIAKKLKAAIDKEPNMRGMLTRDSDYFIPLHDRVVKARAMQADLFVSIHADAFTNPAAKGSSVFALSEKGATSASARYLAKKENESDLIGGVSLKVKDPLLAKTLLDLSQTATINDGLKLGKAVLGQIANINTLHAKHVEQAAFAVLKSPDIPSILVETAFISNPEEERRLNDDAYQDKLVASILTGIKKYLASNPALAKTKLAQD